MGAKEQAADAYCSGTPADMAISAALRAVSEEPNGGTEEDSQSLTCSGYPAELVSGQEDSGFAILSLPLKFVTDRHVFASTQFGHGINVTPISETRQTQRQPLEPIASQASTSGPEDVDDDVSRIARSSVTI